MEPLSEEQITLIWCRIVSDGVTNEGLQNGLLDHYCCFIEEMLLTGADFESAYQMAFQAITPNGTHEIQEELYFILNYKQQTIMKSAIYFSSFLTAFSVSTLIMFKTMHWPGASVLFQVTFLLVIATAIVLFSNSLRHWKSHTAGYSIRAVSGFISALLISVGAIFKSLHLATGGEQVVAGVLLLNLVFLPLFFYHLYRGTLINTPKVSN